MDERTLAILRERGITPGETLRVGVEGTVIDLSSDEVAKVWHGRTRADLERIVFWRRTHRRRRTRRLL